MTPTNARKAPNWLTTTATPSSEPVKPTRGSKKSRRNTILHPGGKGSKVWRRVSISLTTGLPSRKTPSRMLPGRGLPGELKKMPTTNTSPPSAPTPSRSHSQSTDSKKVPSRSRTANNLTISTETASIVDLPKRAWTFWRWNPTQWRKKRLFSARWGRWKNPSSTRKWWKTQSTVVAASPPSSTTMGQIPGSTTVLTIPTTEETSTLELKTSTKSTPKSSRFYHASTKTKKILPNTSKTKTPNDPTSTKTQGHPLSTATSLTKKMIKSEIASWTLSQKEAKYSPLSQVSRQRPTK